MAEHALGIVGQHPVDFRKGFPAMRKQELERVFASWQRCASASTLAGSAALESHCFFHGALLCRAGERGGEFPTRAHGIRRTLTPSAITGAVTSMMQSTCALQIQILFHGGSGHLMHL